MNREDIHAALFARLSAVPGFVTASRRLKHWSDTPSGEQPALFQAHRTESVQPRHGLPSLVTLDFDLYLYAKAADKSASPSSILNPLLDAVTAALAPDNPIDTAQTLGGTVAHCWIEGAIETDEGTLGDQAVAIVPVRILTS